MTYMRAMNDEEDIEERNRKAQRYFQEVVITPLLSRTDVERLLKVKYDD